MSKTLRLENEDVNDLQQLLDGLISGVELVHARHALERANVRGARGNCARQDGPEPSKERAHAAGTDHCAELLQSREREAARAD